MEIRVVVSGIRLVQESLQPHLSVHLVIDIEILIKQCLQFAWAAAPTPGLLGHCASLP